MPFHAALITLLTILLISAAMFFVGRARSLHKVHAPAVSGHPDFERAFRAHQNTLEQTIMFLPVLWLASVYGNAMIASWLGYAWLIGRAWYLFGYLAEAGKRGPGFLISFLALLGLVVLAALPLFAHALV